MKPCTYPGCRALVPLGTTRCAAHQTGHDLERWRRADAPRAGRASRKWYNSAAWRALRQQTLVRDGFTCQWPGCGTMLTTGRKERRAAVIDHKIPHRGDEALFFDPGNLWALCKTCHDTKKQALERSGGRI